MNEALMPTTDAGNEGDAVSVVTTPTNEASAANALACRGPYIAERPGRRRLVDTQTQAARAYDAR